MKIDKNTGEIKHTLGEGDVGLDIGMRTMAVSGEHDAKLFILAEKVQNIEAEKRRLLRKLDRSRRATNPNNFNEDGTIRKQGNKKVKWTRSKSYMRALFKIKELQRKQAAIRKLEHEKLANDILKTGDRFFVEKMDFKALQMRSKKTEKNEKGKFKRKKRFGKSIANRAPAMLVNIIERKLGYFGKPLYKVNTWKFKASMYDHGKDAFKKKKLSDRWHDMDDGTKTQRDLYSAFLLMNAEDNLEQTDRGKCLERFDKFKIMHDIEIKRLKGNGTLDKAV
jgi:hypothetical protein